MQYQPDCFISLDDEVSDHVDCVTDAHRFELTLNGKIFIFIIKMWILPIF